MNFWIDCGSWFYMFEWNGDVYAFCMNDKCVEKIDSKIDDYEPWIDIDVPEEYWDILESYFSDPLFELELLRC